MGRSTPVNLASQYNMHLCNLIVLVLCISFSGVLPAPDVTKSEHYFLLAEDYETNHPDSILLSSPWFKKSTDDDLEAILVPHTPVVEKTLVEVYKSRSDSSIPDRPCQANPEINPRNISMAWLSLDGDKFFITWSDCSINTCTITKADTEDCIFEGHIDDDADSTVLVTGCLEEDNGVQIQSKVHGDVFFITDPFTLRARALVFDSSDFYEEDYIV